MTGLIILPLLISFIGSAIICSVVCFFCRRADIIGSALLTLMCFWSVAATLIELVLQIKAGWTMRWITFFYFDKLLIIGVVWLTAVLLVLILRLIKPGEMSGSALFFKRAGAAFVIFYTFLLVYSFVIIRPINSGEYPLNLELFSTVKEYASNLSTIFYEVFMMFFGNLFYFTPLGYILCVCLRGKKAATRYVILFFFPLAAFSALEVSQYILQNGYCEIDDMLMNSVGFWLGSLLHFFSNKFAARVSHGKTEFFWG